MRAFSEAFAAQIAAPTKEPRFVIEVALDPASAPPFDRIYIASHGDIRPGSIETAYRWDFTSTTHSFSVVNATLTAGATAVRLLGTGAGSSVAIRSASAISPNIDGSVYRYVRVRASRRAGSSYNRSLLYYVTGGHAASASYRKELEIDCEIGQWVTYEFDMWNLTAGGDDWRNATDISQIYFYPELSSTTADWDIDFIEIIPHLPALDARLESVGVVSQRIYPDEGRSTIGNFGFEALDTNASLTTEQRTQLLTNDVGLRGKRVRFFVGFAGMEFADFQTYCTQQLQGVTYDAGVYAFQCQDVQREAKKRVFEPVVLRLAQAIDSTTTTIPITGDTSQLIAFAHDAAYSDAPSSTVAYVRIGDEIIRVPTAGIDPNELTGVTRGALGTFASAHDTQSGGVEDELTTVEEVIYFECNAVKLAYAVLTGKLLGQGSEVLPAHYHAGIEADYIDEASFTSVGADLYNSGNGGVVLRFIDPDPGEAKRWIEQQILRVIGCFLFVRSDGKLSLRRLEEVLHGAAPVAAITDRELVAPPALAYRYDLIRNALEVEWNRIDDETTRITRINDATSITRWGKSDTTKIPAHGLHGSRHSAEQLRAMFGRYRSRYSGPPIVARLQTLLAMQRLEVGDIVQVVTATAVDHTDGETTVGLLRSFEVQGVTLDWLGQKLTFDVFGSTQAAAPLETGNTGEAIPDAWFASGGTDVDSKAEITGSAGVYTVNSNCTLAGHASLSNSAAIWRCDGDLVIPPGVTLSITDNVQLRVKGVLTVNGKILGKGAGLAGVADTLDTSGWPMLPNTLFGLAIAMVTAQPYAVTCQLGNVGYYGAPRAGGGMFERTNTGFSPSKGLFQSFYPAATEGAVNVVPTYLIGWNGSTVTGLPDDLRGSSGGPGGKRHWNRSNGGSVQVNDGGTGGDGGAGLLVICRGAAFGAAGQVDLSGDDGSLGEYDAGNTQPAHAGAGAGGAPGAAIFVVDGTLNPLPVLTNTTIPARYGAVPLPGTYTAADSPWIRAQDVDAISLPASNRISYYAESPTSSLLAGVAASRALYLTADAGAGEDPPPPAEPSPLVSMLPAGLGDYEYTPAELYSAIGAGTAVAFDTTYKVIGSRSLKITAPTTANQRSGVSMGRSQTYFAPPLILPANRRWLIGSYVRMNSYAFDDTLGLQWNLYEGLPTTTNRRTTLAFPSAHSSFERVWWELDLRAVSTTAFFFYAEFTNDGTPAGAPIVWLDSTELFDVTERPELTASNPPTGGFRPGTGINVVEANDTYKGIARFATVAETAALTEPAAAVTPAGLAAIAVQAKVKPSSEARTSTTTLADDSDLAGFDVLAATEYLLEAAIRVTTANDVPDFKYTFQFSQTPQAAIGFLIDNGGTGVTDGTVSDVTLTSTNTRNSSGGSDYVLTIRARVLGHATLDAVLDFQWAQNNSNANATTVSRGSFIRLTPTN